MLFDPVKYVQEKTNLALYYQNALGFAFPPILPFKNIVKVPGVDKDGTEADDRLKAIQDSGLVSIDRTIFVTPVILQLETENRDNAFELPTDPLISISCKNKIIRRNVSKNAYRGTIKEVWNQDDYEINISGMFQSDKRFTVREYQERLLNYCESKTSVTLICPLLNNVFKVFKIAIESYSFAHTKGQENQLFAIKAYSDDPFDLLIELQA
jgi:hypothetical protein